MNPSAPCPDRDSDLLLLAHRQLGLTESLAAHAHLWTCAGCRSRYAQFVSISDLFRAGAGPASAPVVAPKQLQTAQVAFLLTTVALAAVAIFFATTLFRTATHSDTPKPRHFAVPRCAPDLPSDRCR